MALTKDGKLLEELVYNKFKSESKSFIEDEGWVTHFKVKKNYHVRDNKTQTPRQIDVAIIEEGFGGEILIAVECKDHTNPIDITKIEEFITKLEGINANKGIMVSISGFTKKAMELAIKSRGIELNLWTLKDLEEYLYHDYNYFNMECTFCRKEKDWFGKTIHSVVHFDNFENIVTKSGKYIKVFNGTCNTCHTIFYLNSKCESITPVFFLTKNLSYILKKNPVNCKDDCGLTYSIDDDMEVDYKYKGKKCKIINSAHVEFF
ncbi:restriction endonuclease [Heyndrickxia sp. NPDC080065]|uniref:restriction endonuclease n=1 Tax=Heyndrickxia sp. NPDC080065 TaxID=3390568 RepID=UPI003D0425FF